jgi:hypothetical protein
MHMYHATDYLLIKCPLTDKDNKAEFNEEVTHLKASAHVWTLSLLMSKFLRTIYRFLVHIFSKCVPCIANKNQLLQI